MRSLKNQFARKCRYFSAIFCRSRDIFLPLVAMDYCCLQLCALSYKLPGVWDLAYGGEVANVIIKNI